MSYTARQGDTVADDAVGVPVLGAGADGVYRPLGVGAQPDAFTPDEVNVPSAATAAVLTFAAAGADQAHVITGVALSYSATPSGGRLTIADGADTVFDVDIPDAGLKVIEFEPPRRGRPDSAMVITLASGAGSVQGKLNVLGHWVVRQKVLGEFRFSDASESGLLPLLF